MGNPITCPVCGSELTLRAAAPGPCVSCGVVLTVDESGQLVPDETYQEGINKQKYFEIATVIILILVGFGYFAISTSEQGMGEQLRTATDIQAVLTENGYAVLPLQEGDGHTAHQLALAGEPFESESLLIRPKDSDDVIAVIMTVQHENATELSSRRNSRACNSGRLQPNCRIIRADIAHIRASP